jgi:ABC-type nitrate/sulfonate/bicarbonate transport system ATPase subunit
MTDRPILQFRSVSRRFASARGPAVDALRDVSLDIATGQLTAVVGHSGCGKTTLLRIATGLDDPTAGTVETPAGPLRPALLSQEAGLLPWRSILDNITLPMTLAGLARRERTRRAMELIARMHLPERVARSYPHELSGGMRRRAALAVALAAEPDLLALDEPFTGVDEATRRKLGAEVLRLRNRQGLSILLVTHDIEEALALADRIVILRPAMAGPDSPAEASLARDVAVDLPHPRDGQSQSFVELLLKLRASLELPVAKSASAD